ncbi:hypothetical protein U1Q18_016232 [Sarracenia purpurea var. burkii]
MIMTEDCVAGPHLIVSGRPRQATSVLLPLIGVAEVTGQDPDNLPPPHLRRRPVAQRGRRNQKRKSRDFKVFA